MQNLKFGVFAIHWKLRSSFSDCYPTIFRFGSRVGCLVNLLMVPLAKANAQQKEQVHSISHANQKYHTLCMLYSQTSIRVGDISFSGLSVQLNHKSTYICLCIEAVGRCPCTLTCGCNSNLFFTYMIEHNIHIYGLQPTMTW